MDKFYICNHCKNVIVKVSDKGVPVMCCGEKMQLLTPNTVEASTEKHIPVVSVEDGVVTVSVGSVEHPMASEHYIEWIYVQTENGGRFVTLKPLDKPSVKICVCDAKPVAVYAYCNLHGLWVTKL